MRPRWKRCVSATDGDLGEALGQKLRRADLRRRRQGAHAEDGAGARKGARPRTSGTLSVDDPCHQEAGAVKLHAVANKIGYPDKWRDYYSTVKIVRGDAMGN